MKRALVFASLLVLASVGACTTESASSGGGALDAGANDASIDGAPSSDAMPSATVDGGSSCPAAQATSVVTASGPFLSVTGDTPQIGGIADPSLFYPPGAPSGYLTYSNTPNGLLEVHIASSSNAGETWTFASKVNTPTPLSVPSGGTINCGQPSCDGMLTHETSSLIVDPFDPDASRRFKVASQAFIHGAGFLYIHGYMALQTSADGVTWSADEALVEWPNTPRNANPALPSPIIDTSKTSELADCFIVLEPALALRPPSASVDPGAIDLAATCLTGNPKEAQGRIVLFRSTDHAKSFQYKGVLLSSADGSCLGSSTPFITAADLFFVGGQEYVSASLPDPTNGYGGYLNCMIFAVDGAGAVERDADGHPKMLRQLAADTGHLGGACTFAEGASKAGYMGNWGTALPAHIFTSGVTAAP